MSRYSLCGPEGCKKDRGPGHPVEGDHAGDQDHGNQDGHQHAVGESRFGTTGSPRIDAAGCRSGSCGLDRRRRSAPAGPSGVIAGGSSGLVVSSWTAWRITAAVGRLTPSASGPTLRAIRLTIAARSLVPASEGTADTGSRGRVDRRHGLERLQLPTNAEGLHDRIGRRAVDPLAVQPGHRRSWRPPARWLVADLDQPVGHLDPGPGPAIDGLFVVVEFAPLFSRQLADRFAGGLACHVDHRRSRGPPPFAFLGLGPRGVNFRRFQLAALLD